MTLKNKILEKEFSFESFCVQIADWYIKEENIKSIEDFNIKNDLSIIKTIKLLFLSVGANTELLKIFDKWVAVPYGPDEIDIKSIILSKHKIIDGVLFYTFANEVIYINKERMLVKVS